LAQRIKSHVDSRQTTQRAIGINLRVLCPFGGQLVFSKHGLDRTFRNACITIDAGLGMNYEHVIVEVKRFDGANQSAISVTTINAWFGDDISHLNQPPGVIWLLHQQPISQKLRNYIKHEMRRNRSYDVLANDTAMRRSNPALSGVAFSELVRL